MGAQSENMKLYLLAALLTAACATEFDHENTARDSVLPILEYPGTLDQTTFFNNKHGTYFFQYDTGNVGPASFRGESRDARGVVTGYYGYIDPDGVLRVTHYRADEKGYRSTTTLRYLRPELPPTQQ